MGTNDYFKARGTQNYLGRKGTNKIPCEHLSKQLAIVDEINPRPDTLDYYGNLPLFYTVQQDDLAMLEKQFTRGT